MDYYDPKCKYKTRNHKMLSIFGTDMYVLLSTLDTIYDFFGVNIKEYYVLYNTVYSADVRT